MREVLNRVRRVAQQKRILAFYLVLVAIGCTFPAFPLLNLPGYELAAALSLVHGLLGGVLGIALTRRELASGAPDLPRVILSTTVLLWAALIPPFVLATGLTLATPCDPFATTAFFPVLALPSGLVSASFGVLVGRFTRRWWSAALGWLGVILASALLTTWPILFGPQVFAYDHLGGFLPGPLYDEELHLPTSLLWFRVGSIALASLVAAFLSTSRRRRRWLLVSGAVYLGIEVNGTSLGFRMTDAELINRLGGTRETAELTLHYPQEFDAAEVERVLGDVRFRYAQIAQFLGGAPPGRVTVWWYASADQKQRLVGAAHTQFSKPWRREVHVNAAGFPHPVLKHELAHAMAGIWGAPPFGVTGFIPQVGIIEGLAVAADDPVDDLRLHEWAAAMKAKNLLPDVRVLLAPQGFYTAPASRAYTTAGSFLRFLTEKYGPEKLRTLYRDGDFAQAYGKPLRDLATEYEGFLASVTLDEAAVNQAFGRFKRGSIFDRPCAREVARLEEEAAGRAPELALSIYRRCRTLQPAEPSHLLAEVRTLRRLGRDDEAVKLLDGSIPKLVDDATPWADQVLERASIALKRGDDALARALLTQVVERQVSPTIDRTARVRLAGLELSEPKAQLAVRKYFESGNERSKLFFLRDAEATAWPVSYLLGRRLVQDGEAAEAVRYLQLAMTAETPASVAKESLRMEIEAAFAAKDCHTVRQLAEAGTSGSVFQARAHDWVERCDFVEGTMKPLAPAPQQR